MESQFAQKIAELIRMSIADHVRVMMPESVHTLQSYPEAMFADEVVEIDVRGVPEHALLNLIGMLSNNGVAVQRLSLNAPKVTHLRLWANCPSACAQQRDAVLQALTSFQFVDGWRIRDDVRDVIFALPLRLTDDKTWVMGVYYGLEEGGTHGMWNRGTFAVTFADRDSTEIVDVGITVRNGATFHKLAPGKSFSQVEQPPFALL